MNAVQEALLKVSKAAHDLSEAVAEMKKTMDGYGSNCFWQAAGDTPEIRCYKHRDSVVFDEPCGGPPPLHYG